MLQIYNTLTHQKELFKPINEGKVNIYVCGMTVYDYCHLGHARSLVAFDVVTRYLRAQGYDVTYVRNITDVDDKIIARANANAEPIDNLTERFIAAMHEDEVRLGILPPDHEPRATQSMAEIIKMIQALIENDYAYPAENGDVYFRVKKFADYGKLAHKNIDELLIGARVDITDVKQEPLDFVLWKAAKPDEPYWDSPWGQGRPGWHIECSAMSTTQLGNHFDIHGGGADLQFPHHENEIAQSQGASGEQFVNTWMHVGFLRINSQKMSKSLGNFFTIRDVLDKYPAEIVRYFLLSSHYRSPLDFSDQALDNARAALQRFYTCLRGLTVPAVDDAAHQFAQEFVTRFFDVMNDDFNTPEALAVLFDMVSTINRLRTEGEDAKALQLAAVLCEQAGILGLLEQDPEAFLQTGAGVEVAEIDKAEIEQLIAARKQARKDKDWAQADRIRDDLHAKGIELEDGPDGTIWRRV